MSYISAHISNTLLSYSFADHRLISPARMQSIMYLVAFDYAKWTRRTLLEEWFLVHKNGPVLYSVYDKYRCFVGGVITHYIRDVRGEAYVIDEKSDIDVYCSIERIWYMTKEFSDAELSVLTCMNGSAWSRARAKGNQVLSPDDIAADTSYYTALNLRRDIST